MLKIQEKAALPDIVDRETRSRMMSGIRSRNTRNEIIVRKKLFSRGFRYRINDRKLPGTPDIVLQKYNAIIFIHGCFWHGHSCTLFRLPSTNIQFWNDKISGNQKRDKLVIAKLRENSWRIAIIWECALKGEKEIAIDDIIERLADWIKGNRELLEIQK